ncbi:hypothetical protein L1987_03258 [Smallanthus sonchifolius]|uniref:Uncharacterized protein n=1 Tax=Smallanthus sonchifolius TaxID=185202 RepID=A0ACB9KA20_9ASTR|nr:hypothetical protein L1987_03258 [Smallanthus sonchifolius]
MLHHISSIVRYDLSDTGIMRFHHSTIFYCIAARVSPNSSLSRSYLQDTSRVFVGNRSGFDMIITNWN